MLPKIASRDNPKIKHARKVRDGQVKNLVFVEGLRAAEELLRRGVPIITCFLREGIVRTERIDKLVETIFEREVDAAEVAVQTFQSIADTAHSQGIVLLAKRPHASAEQIESALKNKSGKFSSVIYLSEINNPSNLGAILRTAEAAGIVGVIISEKSADAFSPKASRAALGANFRLPVWEQAGAADALQWAEKNDLITTAADIDAEKSYAEIDWKIPRLLVFGSEARGLTSSFRQKIKQLIYIPMENQVESLNLSVACGIILFEAKRQNGF